MTTLKPRWQYEQETATTLRDQLLAGARFRWSDGRIVPVTIAN